MPIKAIKAIRNLRLNHKRRRHLYTSQKRLNTKANHGSRQNNLIRIKRKAYKEDTNIIIGTCNTQSIKNKDLQVSDLLDDYSIDVLILTETWLTSKDTDKQWLESTPLNRHPYQLFTQKRTSGREGGVTLITKNCYTVKKVNGGSYSLFEHATWEVMVRNKPVHFTAIYHPPYSLRNKSTN